MDKNNQIDYTQNLLEDGKDEKYNAMFDNKVDKLNKLQPLPKNTDGWIIDIERITVLKNDEWSYDTYIKSNKTITKNMVGDLIKKIENNNNWDIKEISKEFHGGRPMGTERIDLKEFNGDLIWVVKLKPNLYNYLKEEGHVGDIEDLYENLLRGDDSYTTVLHGGGHELNVNIKEVVEKINKERDLEKSIKDGNIKLKETTLHEYFLDFINKIFKIKYKKKEEKDYKFTQIYKDQFMKNTFEEKTENGRLYYTFINIYKDGKFFEKKRIESQNCPITWNIALKELIRMQKTNTKRYGYIYKLSLTWKGWLLETTDDIRYKINYDNIKYNREITDLI